MGSCSSKTEPQNRLQVLEQRVETLTQMLETSNETPASTKIEETQVDPTDSRDKDVHVRHVSFLLLLCVCTVCFCLGLLTYVSHYACTLGATMNTIVSSNAASSTVFSNNAMYFGAVTSKNKCAS